MTKKRSIPVSNGLYTQEHYEKMGNSIWVFHWLLDKITKEYLEGDKYVGVVLGGKPILQKEVGFVPRNTYFRMVKTLVSGGYIRAKKVHRGIVFDVLNSKKFNKNWLKVSAQSGYAEGVVRAHFGAVSAQSGYCNRIIRDNKYTTYSKPPKEGLLLRARSETQNSLDTIINFYCETKGFAENNEWLKANYPRLAKRAKQLLEIAGSRELAFETIKKAKIYFDSKKLDWTLDTVIKNYPVFQKTKEIRYE